MNRLSGLWLPSWTIRYRWLTESDGTARRGLESSMPCEAIHHPGVASLISPGFLAHAAKPSPRMSSVWLCICRKNPGDGALLGPARCHVLMALSDTQLFQAEFLLIDWKVTLTQKSLHRLSSNESSPHPQAHILSGSGLAWGYAKVYKCALNGPNTRKFSCVHSGAVTP